MHCDAKLVFYYIKHSDKYSEQLFYSFYSFQGLLSTEQKPFALRVSTGTAPRTAANTGFLLQYQISENC